MSALVASEVPSRATAAAARSSILEWVGFALIALASSAWCITAARELGPVFDEPIYFNAGMSFWHTASHHELIRRGTMPLPVDLETLPVALWERAQGRPFDPARDMYHLLPWARGANLVFWWILLFYGWRSGHAISGAVGGMLALAMLAAEPMLLGHAALATTDVAVTACIVALIYHFRTGRDGSFAKRIGWPSLWFAAAILSKVSGLFFGATGMFAVEIQRLLESRPENDRAPAPIGSALWRAYWLERLRPFWGDFRRILGFGLLGAFIYCGTDFKPEHSFVEWAQKLSDGSTWRAPMLWLAENLRIFSNAGEAIVKQFRHNIAGQGASGAYLLGRNARSFWYYYPTALSIKLTLPPFVMLATIAMLQPIALANWAGAAALALFAMSLGSHLQIGIRLVLPLVAFMLIAIAAAAARAWRELAGWKSRLLIAEAIATVFITAIAAVRVWPNGISYANELWGGTADGYRLLSDSNYDWGQGLPELARWQRAHDLNSIDVWYFGTDPAVWAPPFSLTQLHAMPITSPGDALARLRGHYLAASTTMLYGDTSSPAHVEVQKLLRARKPVGRTTTFLIYDFTNDGAPRRAAGAAH
jgi:hypothetical protein